MKIKEKIIHLLGGYTKNEYQMNNNVKARIPVFECERPIETVKAGFTNDGRREIPEDWLKEELAMKIAKKMVEDSLIAFYSVKHSGEPAGPITVYAQADVARPVFNGQEMM